MVTAIHHLAINCIDLKAQEAFYSKHFGFRRVRTFNPGPEEFIMMRLGDTLIELFTAQLKGDERGGEKRVGFKHLCFEVDDIKSTVEQMRNDGIEIEKIFDHSEIAEGYMYCFMSDPENNRVELIQGYVDE